MIIETKYSIGQTVLFPRAPWTEEEKECPDCKGLKVWVTTKPNGEVTDVPCPTCARGYCSWGTIKVWRYRPEIMEAVIDGIRIEKGSAGEETEYYAPCWGRNSEGDPYLGHIVAKDDSLFPLDQRREAHVKAINMVIEARKAFARNAIERSIKGKIKLAKLLDEHNAKANLAWIEKEDLAAYVNDWKASQL